MNVDLIRTFSEHREVVPDDGDPDWSQYLGRRDGSKTWMDLHEKPLVVVLGEAGIGKTIEFQNEVKRLRGAGTTAFFIPLNQLSDTDSWQLALVGHDTEFAAWAAGKEVGHFFLDAVDEARLTSHADFEKALAVVYRALSSSLARARIVISSRVTDWSAAAVRSAVTLRLTKPIELALATKAAAALPLSQPGALVTSVTASDGSHTVDTLVVGLDPLSNSEAHRYAAALGLQDEKQFWTAIADGDYEFMVTRPLDLKWMVVLWNERRSLGTYLQLIEANATYRLREFNESYVTAGEVLSVDQLRAGVIELAAAAEFGGCAYFILDPAVAPSAYELASHAVLTDWQPDAIRRLLATAVFDEASFGRVKFHHRSIREYLAAQWVTKQLLLGVPFQRLQGLFASQLYGKAVLIPARRASLSWLTAINVEAREWVVREFPEILFFEGDPQAWDRISADKAFSNFIGATKLGQYVNWFKSASEFMRVGRSLSAGKVAAALSETDLPHQARSMCFHIARHAKLADCGAVAFATYRNVALQDWERALALDVLEFVGTENQRQEVLADLQIGQLSTNELIAHALPVTDWRHLTATELSAIFDSTRSEVAYGSGPMARVVKSELLPATDLSTAELLLKAVMTSLPQPTAGKRFARFPESDQPEKAWLLDTLPDCYQRVLTLLSREATSYPVVCMEAAERIEAQRESGFTNRNELTQLHKAIALHSWLRWSVALAIAQAEDINMSVNRLTWSSNSLVTFDVEDLVELTRRANDPARPAHERDIWFAVAVAVTFSGKRCRERSHSLRVLGLGNPSSSHAILVRHHYEVMRNNTKHRRQWAVQEAERDAADTKANEIYKSQLIAALARIRNGTDADLLLDLLHFAYGRLGQRDDSDIDFEAIAASLGPDIASAFEDGLMAYWPTMTPPNPSSYADGRIPWVALMALAGLRRSLQDAGSISSLSATDVATAAQLAAWAPNSPPTWFEALVRTNQADVVAALTPWVIAEAQATTPGNGVRGALELVLRCAPGVRRDLLSPLVPLVSAHQIRRRETFRAVIDALREDGILPIAIVSTLCQGKLTASIDSAGRIGEMAWFRIWMDEDAPLAWSWYQQHVQSLTSDVAAEVNTFAEAVGDLKWLKLPLNRETIDLLLGIHTLLCAYPTMPPSPLADGDGHPFGTPSKRLQEAIPNMFLGVRGRLGHDALVALLATLSTPVERNWIAGQVTEHAAQDAAQAANWIAEDLKAISSPFLSEPRTEAQLYEQVMARLEDIRKNLEEGPFSERDLFSAGMPEKFLQRWLAAKFRETQNRRFSVHREEEVDDDNMTDIQLSCAAGNVCVEIKPVDAHRSYSAHSLTDTLQTQIVGQYLRGTNSTRAILVLMQLDSKSWSIPGGATGQPFSALVRYVQTQAESVKRNSVHVNELSVFGIRCVV